MTVPLPDAGDLAARLEAAVRRLRDDRLRRADGAADLIEQVDGELRGAPGVRALLGDRAGSCAIEHHAGALQTRGRSGRGGSRRRLAGLDRGGDARAVNAAAGPGQGRGLGGRAATACARRAPSPTSPGPTPAPPRSRRSRRSRSRSRRSTGSRCAGRDSAGLHLLVRDHGLDLADPAVARLLEQRSTDPLFGSRLGAHSATAAWRFVYKAAAEIGELGDNTARSARRDRATTRCSTSRSSAETRRVSRARPHPLGERRHHLRGQRAPAEPRGASDAHDGPYVTAALNGDVDNYADLRRVEALRLARRDHHRRQGHPRRWCSHGIADGAPLDRGVPRRRSRPSRARSRSAQSTAAPDRVLLALRGSGQALYVGLAEDCFVVASEPYGLVEETPRYLRLDGETPADPERARRDPGPDRRARRRRRRRRSTGIDRARLRRHAAPGRATTSSTAPRSRRATSTGATYPHFLLKEISRGAGLVPQDAAGQARRARRRGSAVDARRRDPARRRSAHGCATARSGGSLVIGQGTAAVAGQSLAAALATPRRRSAAVVEARARDRALGLRPARRHAATRSSSRSARAARRPTPTARSTSRATAARRWSRSSTAATAISSTSPTACSTRPTAATWR